ncbi:GH1 family beta-glucosidase [Metabacillus halosaccharovorans]|uniref:GH1 family beta-glucosidase n=1 Tax=Metabacillus halosaccharovorans TaxID=930124 RepID=UPI001C1F821C|nr:GH1 family beta-glucosidase [Metabacillus halosaccharovorans]MBU7594331.1 beta-glucosidase [Metabacillus halosaccharovorans]
MAIIEFPKEMRWGAATAAYQIEGAANEDGRGLSIWDTFAKTPGKVLNGDNGDVACDSYHRYEEDISLMKELGIDIYRFSVSWPRIFPNGTGEINEKGLQFYRDFVDALVANGIEPMCTLYHWDLPQALQDKGGWDSRETVDAFADYAELMFKEFNGKIKKWITINEPWCVSFLSNYIGAHAPGNQNLQLATTISHHLLLAHGKAVSRFRDRGYEGEIGYAPNTEWNEPFSSRQEDIDACNRATGWFVEWFFDPVFKGSYPQFMVEWFEKKGVTVPIQDGDMAIINQEIDFVGINYYTGSVTRYKENDGLLDAEKVDIGYEKTDFDWNIYPEGFYKVLTKINDQYGSVPIYITENGACYNDGVENGRVKDQRRIDYLKQHLTSLKRAIDSGVNIKGYLTWSLLDNFEWAEGYDKRFGIIHVDFNTLERTKKDSYYWYKQTVKNGWFDMFY